MVARGPVKVVIRPERVGIEPAGGSGSGRVPALVHRTVYLGSGSQVSLVLATGQTVTALVQHAGDGEVPSWDTGSAVTCHLPAGALRVLAGS